MTKCVSRDGGAMNDDLRRPSDEASDDGSTIVRIGEVGRRNPGVCRIYREAVGELSPGFSQALAWVVF